MKETAKGVVMNARDFFQDVVSPNYYKFEGRQNDLGLLWNAVVSMNTVAEYLALHNLGYEQVPRSVLDQRAQQIREQIKELSDLKYCAEAFKHIRKIKGHRGPAFTTIATSTGVASDDQTTWQIDQYDLVNVLQKAFAALGEIAELK